MLPALASLFLLAPPDATATWLAPPPHVQAERDPQRPPPATGAIFVPTMSEARFEPKVLIGPAGAETTGPPEELLERPMGSRTWVRPGNYRVLVGSGDVGDRLEWEVKVVEGRTTFIPAEWAGLRVTVVNERGTPFRGTYELVRLPGRDYVGIGLGADLAQGETLNTWLLRPGTYMLLAAGESYRARKNFVTVRLVPGELVRYTLVLDETTGDVLGAGEIDESQPTVEGPWHVSLLLGGGLSFNRASSVVGKPDGMSFDLNAFVESVGGFDRDSHLFYARLYIEEEGRLSLPEGFYLNLVDTFDVDLLYMYRLVSYFGPYVRTTFQTSLVPSFQDFETPTDVVRLGLNGEVKGTETAVIDTQLTVPFDPLDLRYGAGVRFDFTPTYWFDLKARTGVGARHLFARELFVNADDGATDAFEVREVPDFNQFGVEASLLTELRITRWVLLKAEADALMPFDAPADTALQLDATVSLRLASFASLNYILRLELDPAITDDLQLDQTVLLRFAYKVL